MNMDPIAPTSLREFQKLKTLRCQYSMVSPQEDDKDWFDPKRDLPLSLECLHIDGYYTQECWDHLTASLDGIEEHLPALKSLYVVNQTTEEQYEGGTMLHDPLPGMRGMTGEEQVWSRLR